MRLCLAVVVFAATLSARATVTTTDGDGKRYSLDVQAGEQLRRGSPLCDVKNMLGCGFPDPNDFHDVRGDDRFRAG